MESVKFSFGCFMSQGVGEEGEGKKEFPFEFDSSLVELFRS